MLKRCAYYIVVVRFCFVLATGRKTRVHPITTTVYMVGVRATRRIRYQTHRIVYPVTGDLHVKGANDSRHRRCRFDIFM